MRRKNLFVFSFILPFILLYFSFTAYAADINAASCSQADVQAAVDSASEGDRVLVPAGNCTWTSSVVLPDSPSITLQGAGKVETLITCNTGGGCLNLGVSSSRVTGFRLTRASGNNLVRAYVKADGWRIDHCRIESSTFIVGILVQNSGAISTVLPRGLIDNCEFHNARVVVNGDLAGEVAGNGLWAAPLDLGTDRAVYIEDNKFVCTVFCNVVDGNRGGAYVFRYNIVDGGYLEAHGALSARGHRKWEIYENFFEEVSADQFHFIFLRAGTGVVFNNVADPTTLSDAKIRMDNRRSFEAISNKCNGTFSWDSNEEPNGWLCRDQIQASTDAFLWTSSSGIPPQEKVPAYFWNNTIGVGGPPIPVIVTSGSVDWIQEGRDYFKDIAKPGYTPFTYPHPLRSETDPLPDPPTNLRVVVK